MDLTAFLATPAGVAIQGLLVGTFVVWALGVVAALRDGTFDLSSLGSFVRSTLMGRVVPILIVLAAGYTTNDQLLTTGGIAAAAAVAAEMVGSALDSIKQLTMPAVESAKVNAPPNG